MTIKHCRPANLLPILVLLLPQLAVAGFFDRSQDEAAFLSAEEAFVLEAVAIDHQTIQARWTIAPAHYLYRHRLSVSSVPAERISWQAPQGLPYEDEHFGAVEIYHDVLDLPIQVDGAAREITLTLGWQGCAEAGLCYPPRKQTLTLTLPDAP